MKLCTINKITFKVNILLIALIIFYSFFDYFIESILMVSVVLLHELSHVILCLKYKIPVKEIELFPFGGVARIEGFIADNPLQEIKISIAGPLTNIIILLMSQM